MAYEVEEMPTCRVVYMRQIGPYGADNYALMEKLKKWAGGKGLLAETSAILGIPLDDPLTTPPESCRYDACIVVADGCLIADAEVKEARLSGGRYAVFTIEHTTNGIRKAWNDIFVQLAAAGCQPDFSRPVLERYALVNVDNNLCEICVPV